MSRKKFQAECRANNRGGRWAGIPLCVIESPAYRDLSLWPRAILVELVAKMNGYNNGAIAVSQRQLSEALSNTNYRKIGEAVAELMEHGFIEVTIEGDRRERAAREYRLTFVNTVSNGKHVQATDDYRDWKKSGADDVSARKGVSADDVSARIKKSADDVSARKMDKQRSSAPFDDTPPFLADDTPSSLICMPYPPALFKERRGDNGIIKTSSDGLEVIGETFDGEPVFKIPHGHPKWDEGEWSASMRMSSDYDTWPELDLDEELRSWLEAMLPGHGNWSFAKSSPLLMQIGRDVGIDPEWLLGFVGWEGLVPKHLERLRAWQASLMVPA